MLHLEERQPVRNLMGFYPVASARRSRLEDTVAEVNATP